MCETGQGLREELRQAVKLMGVLMERLDRLEVYSKPFLTISEAAQVASIPRCVTSLAVRPPATHYSAMVTCESEGSALDTDCRAPHNHNRTAHRRGGGGHMGHPGKTSLDVAPGISLFPPRERVGKPTRTSERKEESR